MVGIYLSGTGNTKYCIEKLVSLIHSSAKAIPMESPEAISAIQQNEEIYIGYPTQFSNAPYMVRDFIKKNADIWKNKKILCIATMGAFSGDGAGCTTRMLKRYGATILGGIHIHMPDSVCDSKLLKKTMDENRCIIAQADRKIEEVALQIINGDYPQEGITLVSHIIGLLGQRLWFYKKTKGYSKIPLFGSSGEGDFCTVINEENSSENRRRKGIKEGKIIVRKKGENMRNMVDNYIPKC